MKSILIAWIYVLFISIEGICDFINLNLIYRYLFQKKESENRRFDKIVSIIASIVIMYMYCFFYIKCNVLDMGGRYKYMYTISGFLYLFRYIFYLKCCFQRSKFHYVFLMFYLFGLNSVANVLYGLFASILRCSPMELNVLCEFSTMIVDIGIVVALSILIYTGKAIYTAYYLQSLPMIDYILICITTLLSNCLQSIVVQTSEKKVISIIAILVNMFTMIVLWRIVIVNRKKEFEISSNVILKNQMITIAEYYEELAQKDTEIRKFRHDSKNLLLGLKILLKEGSNAQALEYIGQLEQNLQNVKKQYDTGNYLADAILSFKAKTIEKNQIKVVVDGYIPSQKIEDVDMVILLSNLIDNAIEACVEQPGEKIIHIFSRINRDIWILEIKNPVLQRVHIYKNRIVSTKQDFRDHGFGILNIEAVVEKYNGTIIFQCDEAIFEAKVGIQFYTE